MGLKIRYLKIQWFMIMFPLHPVDYFAAPFLETFQPRYGEFETPRKNRAKEKDWVS
jgi:hypothetical protein